MAPKVATVIVGMLIMIGLATAVQAVPTSQFWFFPAPITDFNNIPTEGGSNPGAHIEVPSGGGYGSTTGVLILNVPNKEAIVHIPNTPVVPNTQKIVRVEMEYAVQGRAADLGPEALPFIPGFQMGTPVLAGPATHEGFRSFSAQYLSNAGCPASEDLHIRNSAFVLSIDSLAIGTDCGNDGGGGGGSRLPEPSTWLLLGTGLIVLAFTGRIAYKAS
jgi:hypothetical protein